MLDITCWSSTYFQENKSECLQLLGDRQFVQQIPSLSVNINCNIMDQKLVRFEGMIQDILNPGFYLELVKVRDQNTGAITLRSGKFCDVYISVNEDVVSDGSESMNQRQIIHCIPIPGLNSWVTQSKSLDKESTSTTREGKRKFETDANTTSVDNPGSQNYKKLFTEGGGANSKVVTESFDINMCELNQCESIPGFILYVYEDPNSFSLRVNDIVEVIGFFSFGQLKLDKEGENSYYDSLSKIHVINLNSMPSSIYKNDNIISDSFNCASVLRDEIWIMLTDLLLGDTLAADYVLCNLISSVYLRNDTLALGKFTLNISNVPRQLESFEYVMNLYTFLAYLLEKSIYVPFTIEKLNTITMIPKKNNDENRLITGLLQVSRRTHLFIDETMLEEGHLFEKGLRNVHALSDIITQQKLEYDFEFYRLPFETDIPALILSSTKSLLPHDVHLVLDPDISCIENVSASFSRTWQKLKEPLLSKLRVYLNNISSLNYVLNVEMQEIIEKDFVEMRKEGSNRASIDDLHRLMVLSRLMSISKGKDSLSKAVWDYSCRMEIQRKSRF